MMISCQDCGQPFTARRCTARFCSDACRARSTRRGLLASDHRTRADRPCEGPGCDNVIGAHERPDKVFCSNACRQRYYRYG
jgi:hypothetical protein